MTEQSPNTSEPLDNLELVDLSDPLVHMAAWVNLGAGYAETQEKLGYVFTDFHYDNIGMSPLGTCGLIDRGGQFIDYIGFPRDWQSVAVSISALFSSAPSHVAAAFRFGYLQHGGPVARLVMDQVREFGFNAFQNIHGLDYEPNDCMAPEICLDDLERQNARWRSLREGWPLGSLIGLPSELDALNYHIWAVNEEDNGWPSSVDQEALLLATEYHTKSNLIAALAGKNRSLSRIYMAFHNIYYLYLAKRDWPAAIVIGRAARRFGESLSEEMPDNVRKAIDEMVNRDYPITAEDKLALSLIPETDHLLHHLWCADDIHVGTLSLSANNS